MSEFAWVDIQHTDPDGGRSALNAAGADGWVFCFAEPLSAHTRIWMTREATGLEEPIDPIEPAPEEDETETTSSRRRHARG